MSSYGRLCTAFYDLDKPFAPADAVAFYRARAERSNGAVLEPMCGSGRFLIPLLQGGIRIEGVDASKEMLAACRRSAAKLGLVPTLYAQSLEELALPKEYGLAFIPAGSLGLIGPGVSLRVSLQRLRRHLNPGATLLLEIVDVEGVASDGTESGSRTVETAGGGSITHSWRSATDLRHRTIRYDSCYRLREGDAVAEEEAEQLVLNLHHPRELRQELDDAGFKGMRVVPPTSEMAWLQASECSLYECRVAEDRANA